jgi:hypothetical protein
MHKLPGFVMEGHTVRIFITLCIKVLISFPDITVLSGRFSLRLNVQAFLRSSRVFLAVYS